MGRKTFKVQAVATMLGITVDAVRRDSEDAELKIERQGGDGPKTRLFSLENIYELAAYRAKKYGIKAKRPVIVTVYAPKGGVGKTTMASNLLTMLPLMGLRTLGVDLDFQANLSMSFGYDPELTKQEALETNIPVDTCVDFHFGHLLPQWQSNGQVQALKDVIKMPFGPSGPHIIPSEVTLDRLEALFTVDAIMSKKPDLAIAKFLHEGVSGKNKAIDLSQYDVIVFDAPPAKNQTTRGALLASDFVIAPVSMEKYSTKSISYLAGVLAEMKADVGKFPELIIMGNFYDVARLRVVNQVYTLTERYRSAWLEKQISSSEEFKKVLSSDEAGIPLALARPSSSAAAEIRAVAHALVQKMGVL